jgi:hypothetical protein
MKSLLRLTLCALLSGAFGFLSGYFLSKQSSRACLRVEVQGDGRLIGFEEGYIARDSWVAHGSSFRVPDGGILPEPLPTKKFLTSAEFSNGKMTHFGGTHIPLINAGSNFAILRRVGLDEWREVKLQAQSDQVGGGAPIVVNPPEETPPPR